MADKRHEPYVEAPVGEPLELGVAFWQCPAMLYAIWWNTVVAPMATPAFWSTPHRCYPPASEDHQLTVPEQVEEEGEHALFA